MVGLIGMDMRLVAGSRMVGNGRANSFATRGQIGRRVVRNRGRKCGLNCSASLMSRYQYARKAQTMAKEGYRVRDFGHRAIGEGCSGPDVLALQEWLAECGYYNPSDGGFNGYFGSVTKEALQMWQRDVGVQVSGCFDSASKMAYLEHVRRAHDVDGSNTSKAVNFDEVVLGKAYPVKKTSVAQVFNGVLPESRQWTIELSYVAIGMLVSWLALSKGRGWMDLAVERVKRGLFVVLGSQKSQRRSQTKHMQATRDQDESIKNATVPDRERRYRQSTSNTNTPRLTREELEKFLAPMKGVPQSRGRRATGPAPYRDDGRITSVYVNKKDNKIPDVHKGIVTPHGVYFASPRKDVMAPRKQQPTPQSNRMESIGYDMNGSMDDGSRRYQKQDTLQNKYKQDGSTFADRQVSESSTARGTRYPVQPNKQDGSLLDGTELDPMRKGYLNKQTVSENVPSRPKFPVPVVRPGENANAVMGNGQEGQALVSESIQKNSNGNTVILHDKPVKLHKPSRLVKDE